MDFRSKYVNQPNIVIALHDMGELTDEEHPEWSIIVCKMCKLQINTWLMCM